MSTTNTKPGFSTCITCRLGFKDAELQRLHYKTEWHSYNSKRKAVNLPPVSLNDYQQKMSKEETEKEETQKDKGVYQQKMSKEKTEKEETQKDKGVYQQKISKEKTKKEETQKDKGVYQQNMSKEKTEKEETQKDKGVYCEPCQKLSANVNAYDNHLNSKKHKYNAEVYLDQGGDIEVKSKKENTVNSVQVGNEDMIEEVDSDECDDDRGNPIDNDECLFCSHQSKNFFKNLEHMIEVHSFFIPDIEFCTDVQGLLRYLGEKITKGYKCMWCNESGRDFRSAEAPKSHMVDKGHYRMLREVVTLAECVDYFDYSSSYPDVKDEMDVDEEEYFWLSIRFRSFSLLHNDETCEKLMVDVSHLDNSEYQLVLPCGDEVGNRSLTRHNKQSSTHTTTAALSRKTKKLRKTLAAYSALEWTRADQEKAARKTRGIQYMKRMRSKYMAKIRSKNKLVTHFRQTS